MQQINIFDCLSFEEGRFWLSDQFRGKLQQSQNAFIIMFIGNLRSGKSQRLNQLLTKKLRSKSPFKTLQGKDPVTRNFQECGPFKFQDFGQFHEINLSSSTDPDIFLIDCEGLNAIENDSDKISEEEQVIRSLLRKAMFALTQISGVTILVMKEMVNLENIENIRSLFGVTKLIQGGNARFESGSIIMIRDVGLEDYDGDFDELNQERKKQDLSYRKDIIEILNGANVQFTEDNLYVLAQPGFEDEDLYWESIKDCLQFCMTISESRLLIPGSMLIELFEESLPIIMEIENLDNQQLNFAKIFSDIMTRKFNHAKIEAEKLIPSLISAPIFEMNYQMLKNLPKDQYLSYQKQQILKKFEEVGNLEYPHFLDFFPENATTCIFELNRKINEAFENSFLEQCITVVVPVEISVAFHETEERLVDQMNKLDVENVKTFGFADLLQQLQNFAENVSIKSISIVNVAVVQSGEFHQELAKLKINVKNLVEKSEQSKRIQYKQWKQQMDEIHDQEQKKKKLKEFMQKKKLN